MGEVDQGSIFFQPAVYVIRGAYVDVKHGAMEIPYANIVLLKGDGLADAEGAGWQAVSKDTAFNSIEGVSEQQSTVVALRWFGYIIGALVIGVFFYVLTIQKIPQIGVLKAIGASNFFVLRQLLIQVVALAVVGIGIAVPSAMLTERALAGLPQAVPIAFTNRTFVTTSAILLVTAVVGALFSGRLGAVDPIIALGQQQ